MGGARPEGLLSCGARPVESGEEDRAMRGRTFEEDAPRVRNGRGIMRICLCGSDEVREAGRRPIPNTCRM
jgi:hypothetical protein